jgi:hypothetical protein
MYTALIDDNIPPTVWEAMPEKLRNHLKEIQKKGAQISYEPNFHNNCFLLGGKTYDKVTVTMFRKASTSITSYNAKNGIVTYSGYNAGPLAAGGTHFDPETGKLGFTFIS